MIFLEKKNGIVMKKVGYVGCGILVKKEQECRIKTPFQTLYLQ